MYGWQCDICKAFILIQADNDTLGLQTIQSTQDADQQIVSLLVIGHKTSQAEDQKKVTTQTCQKKSRKHQYILVQMHSFGIIVINNA
jgi:hypothetical protein